MIAYIRGVLKFVTKDSIVVETGGIGYQINVPAKCLQEYRPGETVELYTHFHLKEDGAQLFGFSTAKELELFKLILGVTGIGPKSALAVLSNLGPDKFVLAVTAEDVQAITRAPGIGKKTAQRLVLELKDKLAKESYAAGLTVSQGDTRDKLGGEVLAAMEALGYTSSEVLPVIKQALQNIGQEASVEQVVKMVLKQFAAK
ncbi:MAG: Holliday junction branch migration protein RuvA [Thermoanaerobacteraceae bacterium]|nr:Holliday junction branch migration protein RuvA [Thermoanaerobacteraceae bacterium]